MNESNIYESAREDNEKISNNNDSSSVYESAQSVIHALPPKRLTKNNESSVYEDAQSRLTNQSKQRFTKDNNSSIYQDAQNRLTKNSLDKNMNIYYPKINMIKKEQTQFSKKNSEYNEENVEEEEIKSEKNVNNFGFIEKIRDNMNKTNEEKINEYESEYSEPKDYESEKQFPPVFEGEANNGQCCNMPRCLIF